MIACLNFHAAYRCRHAGACCGAGWTIPFDRDERARVEALGLRAAAFVDGVNGGPAAAAQDATGVCAFYDAAARRCAVQRAGGVAAMPVSCRMFPRSVLQDRRGTFISLSHYCPTAAGLLFEPGPPPAIVAAPASLLGVGPLDGLDARDAWPPLLRRGVLMDLESVDAWEALGVELLGREGVPPDAALTALERTARRIAAWTVDDGPLAEYVRAAFADARPPAAAPGPHDLAVKRWLAARLFACWIAYQGDGLDAVARHLRRCLDVFSKELASGHRALEALRHSDLRIMHQP